MAHDSQEPKSIMGFDRFPPTVTGHDTYANGIELTLLDPGTQEEPRYIWIPDDESEESVFAL